MSRRIRGTLAALALAVLATGARAQSWETQDEIAFAKDMARYRLFDLATEYIQKLEKGDLSQDERLACLYARAFIEKVGGEYDTTADGRVALLKAAITHYNEFLGKIGPDHKNASDARGEAAACQRRLGALFGELAAKGVDAAASKTSAEAAFRDAIKQLNGLFNDRKRRLDAMPEDEDDPDDPDARGPKEIAKIDAYDVVYELAATFYEWAQLYPDNDVNRQDYLKKCLEQATAYLWEINGTLRALEVTLYNGLANIELNNVDDGIANLEYIIDDSENGGGAPLAIDRNPDLPPEYVAEVTKMVERTYFELAKVFVKQSKNAEIEKLAARLEGYYKKYSARGAKRANFGELFLLELGMARFRAGNSSSMSLLEEVAKRNANNEVGQRAGELIAEAVRKDTGSGGGLKLPPSTWITTGDAARRQNKLLDAIESYHNAIGVVDQIADAKERTRVAVECWKDIGNCYRTLNRTVEAAMCFQEGLAVLGSKHDALDDEAVQEIGISWYTTLVTRFKETKDAQDRKAKDDALRRLASDYNVKNTLYLVTKDEFEQARQIDDAKKEEKAKAFSDCAAKVGSIKQDDANYDRAQILLARCEGEQGAVDAKKYEAALRTLDGFDKYAREHEPPAEKARIVNREVSRTESTYYRSEYLLALAHHEKMLDVLKSFEKDYPNQKSFYPEVNYRRLMALLALNKLAEAEALFNDVTKQISSGAIAEWRPSAGFYLAKAYLGAGDKETDVTKQKVLLAKGAELMVTYCRATAYNSFNNLISAADTYARIADLAKAEEIYRKAIDVFGKDAQYKETIDLRVKRALAEVVVKQRKFVDAAPLYKELEIHYAKDPALLRAAALCYGGWVDVVDKKAVEVPGSGDYKHAIELWDKIATQGFKPEDEKTAPWCEAKFHTIFCRYRAKEVDPSYFSQAQTLMKNFDSIVIEFFKGEPDFLDRLGGEDWKRRWDYLRERLR